MKISRIALFFTFVSCFSASAQQQQTDSLEQLLSILKNDTSKVLILNELSWKYLANEPEKAKPIRKKDWCWQENFTSMLVQ